VPDRRKTVKRGKTLSDWTSGYMADIDYTYGYYQELNPLRIQTAMLLAGLHCPEFGTACELGFGQGISTNFHAGASSVEWWGTDFNPAQAGFAQELATTANAGARLFDQAFDEFCVRDDLPDFDFIGLHGIWSWISDENRRVIVDFVRRKLKVGGVLYISYNTLPGWGAFSPMRHLMTQHAEIIGSEGRGIVSRIDGALEFAGKLVETNPLYSRANPSIADRLKKMGEQNRHYLAHEYFNKDWDPMHFATLANWLEPAKVDFACSAHMLDHFDSVNLIKEQREFLANIPDMMLRQSTRDFMVNQQFRRDYWVKGGRRLSPLQRFEALLRREYVLLSNREDVSLKVTGGQGEATMNEDIYSPVLDVISNHKAASLGSIHEQIKDEKIDFPRVVEAMMVLVSTGQVTPTHDAKRAAKIRKQTDRLNDYLIDRSRSGGEIAHLVSPLTGGGIGCGRFQQLFLGAVKQGNSKPDELAQAAWAVLKAQSQRIVKEGKALEKEEDNLAEITKQAEEFMAKRLPILKAMLIA